MDLCNVSEYGLNLINKYALGDKVLIRSEHIGFQKVFFNRFITAIKRNLITDNQIEVLKSSVAYKAAYDVEEDGVFANDIVQLMKIVREKETFEIRKILKN